MEKVNECRGCLVEKRGIKTRIPVSHTCVKGDKRYKEPATKTLGKPDAVCLPYGTYYQIKIHKRIFETGKATKYSIRRSQYLNGYKVPGGAEAWFPNSLHFMETNLPLEPCIWVHESHYKQLAFING